MTFTTELYEIGEVKNLPDYHIYDGLVGFLYRG